MGLVMDADVIVRSYRLQSFERRGIGLNTMLEMASCGGRGLYTSMGTATVHMASMLSLDGKKESKQSAASYLRRSYL
jgi:hypothetical protein